MGIYNIQKQCYFVTYPYPTVRYMSVVTGSIWDVLIMPNAFAVNALMFFFSYTFPVYVTYEPSDIVVVIWLHGHDI